MNYTKGRGFVDELSPEGRLLLVGTSPYGIGGEAFYLKDNVEVQEALGDSELTEAYLDAENAGLSRDRILIYRLNGVGGSVAVIEEGSEDPLFFVESIPHDETAAGITVLLEEEAVVILDELDTSMTRSYRYEDYETISLLVLSINRDADFGRCRVRARTNRDKRLSDCRFSVQALPMYQADSEWMLVPGEDTDMEWYMEEMGWRLKRAFLDDEDVAGEAYSAPCEVVCLVGIPMDLSEDIVSVMARYAEQKTEEDGVFVTVVGATRLIPGEVTEPGYDVNEDGDYIDELGNVIEHDPWGDKKQWLAELESFMPTRDESMRHIHVVVGQWLTPVGERSVVSAFAATMAQKEAHISMTNKEILGISNFIERLSKKELVRLESNGYTCIVPSVRRNVVAKKSLHFYTYETPTYQEKPNLLRFSSYIGRKLDVILSPYVGEANSFDLDEMKRNIEGSLDEVSEDILQSYEVEVTRPELDKVLVSVSMRVYGDVETIRVQSEVRYEERELFRWMDA